MGGYPVADFSDLLAARRKSIGTQLQAARENGGKSAEELAKAVGIEANELTKLEDGSNAVSISMAEKIASALGISMKELQDPADESPLFNHEQQQRLMREINEMPEDVRAFIVKPSNQPYLKMAMNLSEMEVNRMRDFAEGILDITL